MKANVKSAYFGAQSTLVYVSRGFLWILAESWRKSTALFLQSEKLQRINLGKRLKEHKTKCYDKHNIVHLCCGHREVRSRSVSCLPAVSFGHDPPFTMLWAVAGHKRAREPQQTPGLRLHITAGDICWEKYYSDWAAIAKLVSLRESPVSDKTSTALLEGKLPLACRHMAIADLPPAALLRLLWCWMWWGRAFSHRWVLLPVFICILHFFSLFPYSSSPSSQ